MYCFALSLYPARKPTNNGERRELRENARANAALHIRVSVRVPLPLDPLIESLLVGLRLLHFTTFVRTIPNKGYVSLRYVLIYNLKVSFNFHLTFLLLNRGGSRGRVQGVRTIPPPFPEMTCGFLIQLVFCKKKENYVVYWC